MRSAASTSAPRLAPSSLNWTPTTPTLSVAVAETVIVPAMVAPADGAVSATVGGVVSGGGREVKQGPAETGTLHAPLHVRTPQRSTEMKATTLRPTLCPGVR